MRLMFKNNNTILFGSVIFVILAIPLVSLLSKTGSSGSSDVRARAAVTKTLELRGTVAQIDEVNTTLKLENVYLADENRAGDMKNLGAWTVTPPANFNMASVSVGQTVKLNIDSKTFLVTSHSVTALTLSSVQ